MRVISGTFRSRLLKEVGSENTRETRDRVKESIFNSITNYLYDAEVLDLFAGSGSLGIEALSRGSKSCSFIDNLPEAVETLKQNIKTLNIATISEIFMGDYNTFLDKTYHKFDVIFLDPPYKLDVIDEIVKTVARKKLLNKNGIIVCLYSKNNSIKKENNGIIEYKNKVMGITNISYLKWGI